MDGLLIHVLISGDLDDRTLNAALYTMKTQWLLYCKFSKALMNMCYNETHMF